MEETHNRSYGNDSIQAMSALEANRKSPELLLGSKGVKGARHTVLEIVYNAVDEAQSGYGDKLEIYYDEATNIIEVVDHGRGIPLGYNAKYNAYNWHHIFNTQHAGGKYHDYSEELKSITDWSTFNSDDYPYFYSVGTYGIGASATQQTSDFLDVVSIRDGLKTTMHFKEGRPVVGDYKGAIELFEPESVPCDEPTGTSVTWRPSPDVFYETHLGREYLKGLCVGIAHISKVHVTLYIKDRQEKVNKFDYPVKTLDELNASQLDSVSDILATPKTVSFFRHGDYQVGSAPNIQHRIWVSEGEISYAPVREYGRTTAFYNGMQMHGGVQFEGVNSALRKFLREVLDTPPKPSEYEGVLNVIVNAKSNHIDYNGADKNNITSTWMRSLIEETLYTELKNGYTYKLQGVMSLVSLVKRRVENRVSDEETKAVISEVKKETRKAKRVSDIESFTPSINYVKNKFLSKTMKDYATAICDVTEPSVNENFYVEGDSAAGSAKGGRNRQFQCVTTTTGKTVNPAKVSNKTALSKQFIKDIIQINGAGFDIPTMPEESTYNASVEKIDKHIIMTDADKDGYHIRNLIFLAFFMFLPEVIRRGRLFIVQAPLYIVKYTNGHKDFALTLADRNEFVSTAGQRGLRVESTKRLKGLGEMPPEDLSISCMNPETRHLVQILADPYDVELQQMILDMFGASTLTRRATISLLLGIEYDDVEKEMRSISKEIYDDERLVDDLDEDFIIM